MSSVGILDLPFRPMHSNISLIAPFLVLETPTFAVSECQSYSQFCMSSFQPQTLLHCSAPSSDCPGDLQLGGGGGSQTELAYSRT